MKKNKTILLLVIFLLPRLLFSQTRISIATDASLQRNFKKDQRFWSFGQDVVINWHFTGKSGAYASVCYYSNGKFKNQLSATAKSTATLPQQFFFTNHARVSLKQISLGWKYDFVGASNAEVNWNLYGVAGFGLIIGKATNSYSIPVDTLLYNAPPPIKGIGHFKRLTLDLGLGWEIPIGNEIYFYSEGRIWIPTTDYPSKYLFVNNNAPFAGMIAAGLRVLF